MKDQFNLALILFTGNCCLYSTRAIMSLVIRDISNDFGWTRMQSGLVLSAFFWGYSLTQIFAGVCADKYGGHIVIQWSTFGWSLLTFLLPFVVTKLKYYLTDPLTLLISCRLLTGCFQGFFYPSLASISSNEFRENRSMTYSFIISGSYLGTVVCGGFGSYYLTLFGWPSVFYFFGVISTLWNCIYIMKYGKREQVISQSHCAKSNGFLKILFFRSAFWALIFAYLCQNIAFSIIFSWLPSFFRDKHPLAQQWVVNVLPWCIGLPLTAINGSISDRIAHKYSLTTIRKSAAFMSLVATGLCLWILSIISESLIASVLVLMLALSCYSLNTVGLMINPQDICPDNAGAVFGFMNMIGAIPGFAGVIVVGSFLHESNNDWNTVFRTTSFICMCGYAVYFTFGTARRIV